MIKESLRLTAPVPSLARRTVADTEVLGHHLPAGTLVSVSPNVNHYAPEYWTAPRRFDPDRFGPARREDKSHRYAWMPFGGGAHKCIGMRLARVRGEGPAARTACAPMVRTAFVPDPLGLRVTARTGRRTPGSAGRDLERQAGVFTKRDHIYTVDRSLNR